ncbi:MAG: nitronate monooxygenase, partial [Actinomycetota bacterium]|nr:nitronate monooxygenase [Actinomycetota bacterium]
MLQTRLTELFGIDHPVLNAPMGGGDAPARLAAAVSEAGGLGLIGGTTVGGAEWLVEQIRIARQLTDRPFGVGFISHLPNAAELMAAALREGVRIVAHSFSDPAPFVGDAHAAGAIVMCQVRTVEAARRAADCGVDVITAQGTEAGGHTGMISTLPLVPRVVDAVAPVPVVAAGGIADGRGIAAALMLGAEAVWIGTRFLATDECGVSDAYKARIMEATGDDTVLTDVFDLALGMPWPDGVSGRAIRNDFVDRWDG